jgi:osmoprotectant transport system permease protein
VNFFSLVAAWFADPANWSGTTGVPNRLVEHMQYCALAVAIAMIIAIPVGAFIGHTGRGRFLVVGVANGLRALPELGVLMLAVLVIGISLVSVVVALVVLAVPPLLAGTYAGVRNVDRAVVDAARGMGMREREVLLKVEMPNALPLVFGGLRSAMLQVIATATIAAFVSFGGLGRYLIDGLGVQDYTQMAAGAVLVAALALAVEAVLAGLQRLAVSPGLRDQSRRRPRPVSDVPALPESRKPPVPLDARS